VRALELYDASAMMRSARYCRYALMLYATPYAARGAMLMLMLMPLLRYDCRRR